MASNLGLLSTSKEEAMRPVKWGRDISNDARWFVRTWENWRQNRDSWKSNDHHFFRKCTGKIQLNRGGSESGHSPFHSLGSLSR